LSATIIPYFFKARRITCADPENPAMLKVAFSLTLIPMGGRFPSVRELAKCLAGAT
jgi:hypothetical protein